MSTTSPTPEIVLPPIRFDADGPSDEIKKANLEAVLPFPGYPHMALILADALVKRADIVLFDCAANQTDVRFQIDGVWHSMPALDRQTTDYLLATLKRLTNLEIQERRARQQEKFTVEFMRKKFKCQVISQGVKTGERVAVYVDRKRPATETLEECGMRPALAEQVRLLLAQTHGMFLVSGLPSDGFTTTWRATLNACDRFTRDYFVVEEASRPEPEVINVASHTYDESQNQDPTTIVPGLLLRQPDVVAVTEMKTGRTIDFFCDVSSRDHKAIITRTHGKSAIDGLLRMLALKPTIEKFSTTLTGVLSHRLLRKLCEHCKRGFPPSPQLMQQLGLPPGRVATMYQRYEPRPEDLVDKNGRPVPYKPCVACGGIGFMERTAIFELLVINDALRKVLLEQPRPDKIYDVARQHGFITMRDEGIVLVARGVTSVEELQRVLSK